MKRFLRATWWEAVEISGLVLSAIGTRGEQMALAAYLKRQTDRTARKLEKEAR